MEENEIHLVKRISKKLGEKIGYSETNLKGSVSTNQISKQIQKF